MVVLLFDWQPPDSPAVIAESCGDGKVSGGVADIAQRCFELHECLYIGLSATLENLASILAGGQTGNGALRRHPARHKKVGDRTDVRGVQYFSPGSRRVLAHDHGPLVDLVAVRDDCATFSCGYQFRRTEAEARYVGR
jgi:hypothetical protein